ncbi:MAG: hypothetical protein K1X64_22710 [Myxococcaceae bacterium]|nr:hypothetical protein [Myxococcaceae bacterium]
MKRNFFVTAVVVCALFLGCGPVDMIVGREPAVDGGHVLPRDFSLGEAFFLEAPRLIADDKVQLISTAFDGQLHLVAWTSPYGLRAARFDRDGKRLDDAPLTIAPSGLWRGNTLKVVARSTGGFWVMWQGPVYSDSLSITSAENEFSLYVAPVNRDGTVLPYETSEALFWSFSLAVSAPLAGEQRVKVVRSVPYAQLVDIRTFAVSTDTGQVRDLVPPPNSGLGVPVPGLVSPAHLLHLNDRLYLATVAKTAQGTVLEVRALTTVGPVFGGLTEMGTLIFSAPLAADEARLGQWRDFALAAVDDHVVLTWKTMSGLDQVTVKAVSIFHRGDSQFDVSATVSLGTAKKSTLPEHFETFPAGQKLLVPIRLSSDEFDTPLSLLLDPKTMVASPGIQTTLAPPSDIYYQGALRGCSYDGEACLAVVHFGYSALAKRVLPNGAFGDSSMSPLFDANALPGTPAMQRNPRTVCGTDTCLVAWTDNYRLPAEWWRGNLIDKATGALIFKESFRLPSYLATAPALVATSEGFWVAQAQCSTDSRVTQLLVQALSARGEWQPPMTLTFDDMPCSELAQVAATVADKGVWFAISGQFPVSLGLAILGSDGVLVRRPLSLPLLDAYDGLEMVALKDHVLLALESGSFSYATAVLPYDTTSKPDQLGLNNASCSPTCTGIGRRLVVLPGQEHASWVDFVDTSDGWGVRIAHFDAQGLPGEFLTLSEGRGTWGSARPGLEAVVDENGLSVLFSQREWRSEPFNTVFQRFDITDDGLKANPPRTVATDILLPGQALAYAGNGQWLATYLQPQFPNADIYPRYSDMRIAARFLYAPVAEGP